MYFSGDVEMSTSSSSSSAAPTSAGGPTPSSTSETETAGADEQQPPAGANPAGIPGMSAGIPGNVHVYFLGVNSRAKATFSILLGVNCTLENNNTHLIISS